MTEHASAARPPLDEVMLAMDVVDTLRHRERMVERALSADERDAELADRLKDIYSGQGIEVSDAIVEQGVRDLREDRFAYKPPPPSFGRSLARLYVSRRRWGPVAGFGIVIFATLAIGYQAFVRGPALEAIDALPGELEQTYSAVVDITSVPEALNDADVLLSDGRGALELGDHATARGAIAGLDALLATLQQQYRIRVLSEPGELSGIWRIPDANRNAQNYYLIVEAIDADGDRLVLPILNEETGRTSGVRRWGQRVSKARFDATVEDKQDDGIIQNGVIGEKQRGMLEPVFQDGVLDGAITSW
jgi:hypothetical protein